ncbi:MAG: FtsX-like permease family protein [Clostridia bacterium]|nr:FtsX-like permease family protein [Clostridia bacterium]
MKSKRDPWRHRRYTTARGMATFGIVLVLFVLGLLALLAVHTHQITNYLRGNVGIKVMLKENSTHEQAVQLMDIIEGSPMIERVSFVSCEEAARGLQQELGEDFTEFLGYNPLPASLEVFFTKSYFDPDSTQKVVAYLQGFSLTDEVFYPHALLHDVNRNLRRITTFTLSFSILLIIISMMLIYNTVRLAVYSRRMIIKSMLLVGATGAFIRAPFVRSGLLQGAIGGGGACLLLLVLLAILKFYSAEAADFIDPVAVIGVCLLILIFGLLISGFSNYLAVKKYLKVRSEDLY